MPIDFRFRFSRHKKYLNKNTCGMSKDTAGTFDQSMERESQDSRDHSIGSDFYHLFPTHQNNKKL